MQTQPMFDDTSSKIEHAARTQMGLNDDWQLETQTTALHTGVEEKIDELLDSDLSDGERWRELVPGELPLAWLPKGLILVTMRRTVNNEVERKAGFIWVDGEPGTGDPA